MHNESPVLTKALFAALLSIALIGCNGAQTDSVADVPQIENDPAATSSIRLQDVTAQSGMDFQHFNGMTGIQYFVEIVGSGVALFDADQDGDLDVLMVQSNLLPSERDPVTMDDAIFPRQGEVLRTRLYRNDWQPGIHIPHFVDITAESGIDHTGYGMGVAVADVDLNGYPDVYITSFGDNQLWLNQSATDGIRFTDFTEQSGSQDSGWSTSASFADVNQDGLADLYIANYAEFRLENHKQCLTASGIPNYCGPMAYRGARDSLFLNLGNGRFSNISQSSGIHSHDQGSTGLGVVIADFNGDFHPDIYVANDMRRNYLWLNDSDSDNPAFTDHALLGGSAVAMDGRPQASMGVVAGDLDNDDDNDLFMTHLSQDHNTLYRNNGNAQFSDLSVGSGLASASMPATGFGTVLADLDNDGWLDIVAANGEVSIIEEQMRAGSQFPLRQPNQVFHHTSEGFVDITDQVGDALTQNEVSRGVAAGDLNNDGLVDLVITNNNAKPQILLNETKTNAHWLALELKWGEPLVDALGAIVWIELEDGRRLRRRVATDGSYLSASDPRLIIGTGSSAIVQVTIRWPDGVMQTLESPKSNQFQRIIRPDKIF